MNEVRSANRFPKPTASCASGVSINALLTVTDCFTFQTLLTLQSFIQLSVTLIPMSSVGDIKVPLRMNVNLRPGKRGALN